MGLLNLRLSAVLMLVSSLAITDSTFAADESDGAEVIEEIVVLGRLKQESIQDIPASVTAVGGEELQTKGVVDIQILQHSVPNFRYTTNVGPADNLVMRGIGTIGSGVHFEPAVGQQLNGVAFTRSRLGRAGLIDTAQVEVLRGPQGAVTGKNTSLGLVNIVPNKPTDEFEASIFTRYDFEDAEGWQVEGVLSGALTDRIRGRVAVNVKDQDGWVDNTNVGGTAQTKDDVSARGIVEFDLTDRASLELFYQTLDAERDGKPREIINCTEAVRADPFIGNGDCELNRKHQNEAVLDAFGNESIIFPERFEIDWDTTIATFNLEFGDDLLFTSITSYTDYLMEDLIDTDLSPAGRLNNAASANRNFIITNAEDFEQRTQELRLSGSLNESTTFIVGALYSEYEIDYSINSSTEGFGPGPYRPANRYIFGEQENEGYSVFFDITHDISEAFTVNAGLRYISEDRSAFAGQIMTRTGTGLEVSNFPGGGPGPNCLGRSGLFSCSMFPATPAFFDGTLLDGANVSPVGALFATGIVRGGDMDDETDTDVTGNVNLQWRPNENVMYYVSVATGFKAGGFQLAGSLTQDALSSNFSFDAEETVNIEVGGRHSFDLDNSSLELNWTLFNLDIDGQQVSSLDPIAAAQVVQSDGEARSQGLEVDGRWMGENWTIGFDVSYTDVEYTKFDGGACYRGQTEAQGCIGGVQDRDGTTLAQAPEIQAGLYIERDFVLDNGFIITPYAQVRHVDDHYADTELNPFSMVDAYNQVNASITVRSPEDTWSVALVGTNLSDELHWGFFNESGSVPGTLGGQGAFGFPNIGRQLALTAKLNFD